MMFFVDNCSGSIGVFQFGCWILQLGDFGVVIVIGLLFLLFGGEVVVGLDWCLGFV